MNLSIDLKEKEDGIIVKLRGEIDIYTASKLKASLIPLTEKKGQKVCVDLKEVTYLDSSGLGIFIHALKSATKNESDLQIIRAKDRVLRLFEVTGLNEIMTIKTEDEVKTGDESI